MNHIMRQIAALVSIILIMVVLSGCGLLNSENASMNMKADEMKTKFANNKLNVAVFDNGNGSKEKYWRTIIQKFETEYPGVQINLQANPRIIDMITPQIIAGSPPDLIVSPPNEGTGIIEEMMKDKMLLDLTDLFEGKALDTDKPLKDILLDGILKYAKPLGDGKIYSAPFTTSAMGLIYNKDLFERKGWKPPKTWNEFMALGEAAKNEGRFLFTYPGVNPGYNESIFWSSVASAGGMDAIHRAENYEKGAFKSSAVQKTMEIFSIIAQKGYLLPGSVNMNHMQSQSALLQGKALFIPTGTWIEDEMKDAARESGFQFGFLAPPVFKEGDQQYAEHWQDNMYIPAKAKNTELAKELIRYQYTDDSVKLNAKLTKNVTAVKNGAELAKPYISPVFYDAAKIYDNGIKPLLFHWKLTPSSTALINNELWRPIGSIMNKLMSVSQWQNSVEAATAKIRADLEERGKTN